MDKEPTICVGVDWAGIEHQVCVLGPASPVQRRLKTRTTSRSPLRPLTVPRLP